MTAPQESDKNGEVSNDEHVEDLITCLPECEHFTYPLQVAIGTISDRVPLTGIYFYKDVDLRNRSVVNVFFNDLVSTKYRRDAYLNWQNVLASFGGLLSLMLGFTLISVFDFVLFFTVRVLYNSVSRFFKHDDLLRQYSHGHQGYYINVEEHKNDKWIKNARQCNNYKDGTKKIELYQTKTRY